MEEKMELSTKSFCGIKEEMISTLPTEPSWNGNLLYLYQNFWCPSIVIKGLISFRQHFKAHDTDLIVATFPKSGTTWLKALTFAVVKRAHYTNLQQHPLLTNGPHDVVPFLEADLYLDNPSPNLEHGFSNNDPRIFATHVPYEALPSSIKDSGCRIVYVCRNPLDQFISQWHFLTNFLRGEECEPLSLEDCFENYCRGVHGFGPFWDHILGYWKASLERPDKVLFFKYEDMKEDIGSHVRRLAEFSGFPFSMEEENGGVIEEISKLCDFETLKDLAVNKNGRHPLGVPNRAFFRKAEVGDWTNYLTLTPFMTERLRKLMEEKLTGSGLSFKISCQQPSP